MSYKAISEMTEVSALNGAEQIEVSQLSSSVTITASTISALAADNSFNDSGSGFVTAGFAAGNRVKVTGFTGNTANNIFTAVITALTAGKMTIGGIDGDVIVDDAAGESVTITKWVSRRAGINKVGVSFAIGAFIPGTYSAGQRMAGIVIPIACTIPANLTGSTARVFEANPTASTVISLRKNGTEFGTITIATNGACTLAAASETSFNGTTDYLEIIAPLSADSTLAGLNINIKARRD